MIEPFDPIKRRAPFVRASLHEWRRVGWWLATFAVLFALPAFFLPSGPDRVQWQGMFFQWAGIFVVAWGLADTRRNLFHKPPLWKALSDRLRRLSYIIKPPGSVTLSPQGTSMGVSFGQAQMTIRRPVIGDHAARIEALTENQRLIDEDISRQQQALDRLHSKVTELNNAERGERSDADKSIRDQLENAIIGGIHLEVAGVAFLFVGIACTSIPNWIASWLHLLYL